MVDRRQLFPTLDDPFFHRFLEESGIDKELREYPRCYDGWYKPVYSFQGLLEFDSTLTYRRINDWENKGLISPGRHSGKEGWRKFNTLEAIVLTMISDLRRFGLPREQLLVILDTLKHRMNVNIAIPTVLDILFNRALGGDHVGLLLTSDGKCHASLTDDLLTVQAIGPERPKAFVYIPFADYVGRVVLVPGVTDFFDPRKYAEIASPEMLLLLQRIGSGDYEQVTLTRRDGRRSVLRALKRQKGDISEKEFLRILIEGDFSRIEAFKADGRIVGFVKETLTEL